MLENVGARNEELLISQDGSVFMGRIMPADDRLPPSYDFSTPRLVLHTRPDADANPRDCVRDQLGRWFLLGYHDVTPHRKSFVLFQATGNHTWTREVTQIDPLTRLAKGTGQVSLGNQFATVEMNNRSSVDPGFKVSEETYRLMTNAFVSLGDVFDNMIVKRTHTVFGLTYAEVQ